MTLPTDCAMRLLTALEEHWSIRVWDVAHPRPDEMTLALEAAGIPLAGASWVAVLPPTWAGETVLWMDDAAFGHVVRRIPLDGGWEVRVGYHGTGGRE